MKRERAEGKRREGREMKEGERDGEGRWHEKEERETRGRGGLKERD